MSEKKGVVVYVETDYQFFYDAIGWAFTPDRKLAILADEKVKRIVDGKEIEENDVLAVFSEFKYVKWI